MEQLLVDFLKLGGFAAFATVLISVGKKFGIVADGTAGKWNLGLNVVGFALFVLAHIVNFDIAGVDTLLGQVSNVLVALLAIIGQLGITKGSYAIGQKASIPLLGYSRSK